MKNILCVISFLSACVLVSAAHAEGTIKEGKWSVTAVSTTTGLPQAIPPQTMTNTACVTNKNPVPNTKMPAGCDAPQIQVDGSVVSFQATCDVKSVKMDMSGRMTYNGDTMQGTTQAHVTSGATTMNTTVQITGKYIGPCQ